MGCDNYDYEAIAKNPKLYAFYLGWLGQRICYLTYRSFNWGTPETWQTASSEIDRLLLLHDLHAAGCKGPPTEADFLMVDLLGYYGQDGVWHSEEGLRMRNSPALEAAFERYHEELEEDPDLPFLPILRLDSDTTIWHLVASEALAALERYLLSMAERSCQVGLCRLGIWLSGCLSHSLVWAEDGGRLEMLLADLDGMGMTDLGAENDFRRKIGLLAICSGWIANGRCLSAIGVGVTGRSQPDEPAALICVKGRHSSRLCITHQSLARLLAGPKAQNPGGLGGLAPQGLPTRNSGEPKNGLVGLPADRQFKPTQRPCSPPEPPADVSKGQEPVALPGTDATDGQELYEKALNVVFKKFHIAPPPLDFVDLPPSLLTDIDRAKESLQRKVREKPKKPPEGEPKAKRVKVTAEQNRGLLIGALFAHHRTGTAEANPEPASQDDLAKMLGWSQSTVSRAMELLFGRSPMRRYRQLCRQDRIGGFIAKADDGSSRPEATDPHSLIR